MVTMRRARLSQERSCGPSDSVTAAGSMVVTVSVGPLLPLAPREGEVAEQRCEDQERDHRHRDRRAFAELRAGDGALEGQRCHEVGGVDRPAAGDGVDELEVGEGEQHREGHDDRQDRHEQGRGDVAEFLPAGGAVEQGGLIERGGDGLQPGQQGDGYEGNAAPDIRRDQRPTSGPGGAEEIHIGVAPVQHVHQHVGDDGELRVVDPPERDGAQHRRHDVGQQDDGAQHGFERDVFVQQQGEPQAEGEFYDGGHRRVEHGVPDGGDEHTVGDEVLEVLQPDPVAVAADLGVGEGEPDAQAERVGEEGQQQPGGRKQADTDQEYPVVEQAGQPAWPRA